MTLPPTSHPGDQDARGRAADAAFRRFLQSGDPAAIADLFDLAATSLHRTALHLVGDDATAHDLVQTTFLVALQRRGFDERRPVLPWLGGILRNQAALVHRRRARGLDRERLLAEPSEDPAERAAAQETAAEVAAALERLPAAFQAVVRLHVVHGLDSGAIAASLQRPGGTVRTQLMRGLEKLRQLLPVGVAGVLAGLLPAAAPAAHRTAVVAAAAAAGRSVAGGAALVLRPRAAWWLLAAATIGLAVFWWDRVPDVVPAVVDGNVASVVGSQGATASPGTDEPVRVAPGAREPAVVRSEATFELRGVVTGTVLGADDRPAGGAEVLVWNGTRRPVTKAAGFEPAPLATATTAPDGTFVLQGSGAACYVLARSADAISEHAISGQLDGRERVEGLQLRLRPVVALQGRLVGPDGRAVPHHAFGTNRGSSSSQLDRLPVVGFRRCELPDHDVRTDGDGRFTVRVAAHYPFTWEVLHQEHPMLRVTHRAEAGPLTLTLAPGATVRAVAWLADGAPALGAEFVLVDHPRRRAIADASGRATLRGAWLREGLWMHVEHPDAAIHCLPVGQVDRELEARLEAPRVLAGRLLGADGQPLAGRELRIVGDRTIDTGASYGEPSTFEFVLGRSRTTTAADGSFRFERLYDGMFSVELASAAGEFQSLARVRSGVADLELRGVASSVVLTGTLRNATARLAIEVAKVTVWRRGDDGSWSGRTQDVAAPAGRFRLEGLAPGEMRLVWKARGCADTTLAERLYGAGEHTLEVAMLASRTLDVEVRRGDERPAGHLGVHLGDGRFLQLPTSDSGTSNRLEVHAGKARLEGLPAGLVTVVCELPGEEPVVRTIDLTQPPQEPLVFDLDALQPSPELAFAVLVFTCGKEADAAKWAGRVDREWFERVTQDPSVRPLSTTARLTFRSETGRQLATGSVGPAPAPAGAPPGTLAFRIVVNHANGDGMQSDDAPAPAVEVRLRGQAVVLHVEADGLAPVTRRIEAAELVGEQPAVAVFLRPR